MMMILCKILKLSGLLGLLGLLAMGCAAPAANSSEETITGDVTQTEMMEKLEEGWWKDAVIYEVNIRQYTPEGTFQAFQKHLPRLADQGVDILWFMPIFPISQKDKKGTLGSYYAINDHETVNPNFGTLEDFKAIIAEAHDLGMKVVLDWVPNHTGRDHKWITQHREWYNWGDDGVVSVPRDGEGKLTDWTDVADLNYENPEMRLEMIKLLNQWVTDHDIDGYRFDVAFFVEDDFWAQLDTSWNVEKPLFLLAEAERPSLRNEGWHHATYGWSLHHLMNDIAKGKHNANDIQEWMTKDKETFTKGFPMIFITNHDENSWNGTEFERMGDGVDAFAAFTFSFVGMPLIYSGQEAGFNRRLEFFEKDSIDWGAFAKADFYSRLAELKHDNPALWNGENGGYPVRLKTNQPEAVFAFSRTKGDNQVVGVFNFTANPQPVTLEDAGFTGTYFDGMTEQTVTLAEGEQMTLKPWEFRILVRN